MNEIMTFENANIEIITTSEEPLFSLMSVGIALGYVKESKNNSYPRQDRILETAKRADITAVVHGGQLFITESQVYDFMLEARTDKCKKFRKWLTNEVLPTIRKTGSYSIQKKPDSYTIDDPAARARRWAEEYEERKALEMKIEEDKPKVDFANQISDTTDLIDIGALSKLLKKKGLNIGRNKLFEWLRNNGFLRANNEPYQKYVNAGYFKTKEFPRYGCEADDPHIIIKTYVTGRGQQYIFNKLSAMGM